MILNNIIIPFDGLNSEIPNGFVRDTRFDNGYFLIGENVSGFGGTGGTNTHSHTASHTHTVAAHTHMVGTGDAYAGDEYDCGLSGGVAPANHSHSGPTNLTGTQASGSATTSTSTSSHIPPYYEIIFIRSLGNNPIPAKGMVFSVSDRAGMTYHTASQNRFLRGAVTSGDSGSTGGVAHTHTQSHTHTVVAHSHTGNSTRGSSDEGEDGMSSPGLAHGYHTHAFSVNTASQPMNSNSTTSSSTFPEPYHKTLKHYKTLTRILPIPGDIAMVIDGDTPEGWVDCDGANGTPNLQGFYIKNTTIGGSTGGATTHTHTISHNHTGSAYHSHTTITPTGYGGDQGGHNGGGKRGRRSHVHGVNSPTGGTLADYNTTVATTNGAVTAPIYIKVRFIQMLYTTAGGSFISVGE